MSLLGRNKLDAAFRLPLALVVAGMSVVSLFGCSSSDNDDEQSTYADALAQAKELAPEAQQEAISDGTVTFAEYEAAVFATIECFKRNGIEVAEEPHLTEGGRYDYGIQGSDDPEKDNAILEKMFACQDEHLSFIESLHFHRDPLSPEEEDERLAGFIQCASGVTGLEYRDVEGPGQVMEQTSDAGLDPRRLEECLAEFGYG